LEYLPPEVWLRDLEGQTFNAIGQTSEGSTMGYRILELPDVIHWIGFSGQSCASDYN
jgi:hypothetical protein